MTVDSLSSRAGERVTSKNKGALEAVSPAASSAGIRAGCSSATGLRRGMLLVAALAFVVGLAAIDARATNGTRTTADEPQYLTTALSLAEDFDLDISDEIRDQRYLPFHELALDQQTIDLNNSGQRISPHDPLLPLLLAVPMGLGGWALAKAALAAIAALTAAATLYLAVRRFDVSVLVGSLVVGSLFVSPPLTSYATQVYPEMPAAFLVAVALIAIAGPLDGRWRAVALVAIVAMPWLAVKYVPIAAVLAAALLVRVWARGKRVASAHLAVLAIAGVLFLVVHQRIYGGWTVYAAGDHFVSGELRVIGNDPNYVGRSRRLIGLLVDRSFGLIAWTPAFILLPAAMVAVVRLNTRFWSMLLAVIGIGWAMATWVAFTMHGWWWPGRQLVVILPAAVVVMAIVVERVRALLGPVVLGCAIGTASWLWLAIESSTDRRTLIFDFDQTSNPWYRIWSKALPNHREFDNHAILLTWVWVALLGLVAAWLWAAISPKRSVTNG